MMIWPDELSIQSDSKSLHEPQTQTKSQNPILVSKTPIANPPQF